MGKVSYERDIDSQIAKVREHGYRKTEKEKVPRRFRENENRYFVKSFSGVLNVYAIITSYGRLFHYFELERRTFTKMIEELKAVTKIYKRYSKVIKPKHKKYEGKIIGRKELQKIFALTKIKKNKALLEKASRRRCAFLKKYSDLYSFCVRFTVTADGVFLLLFRLGQSMKKSDRSLFFKFFDAILENYGVYVETAGRPKGTGVTYTDEGVERAGNRYKEREKDCKAILDELRKSPFPYQVQELARKYNIPADLLRNVIKGLNGEVPRVTLRTLTLSVLDWEIFGEVKINPEYLRKKLQRRKSHSQSY